MGADLFWELVFFYFGNRELLFFSMVSIGGGDVSGGGGLWPKIRQGLLPQLFPLPPIPHAWLTEVGGCRVYIVSKYWPASSKFLDLHFDVKGGHRGHLSIYQSKM